MSERRSLAFRSSLVLAVLSLSSVLGCTVLGCTVPDPGTDAPLPLDTALTEGGIIRDDVGSASDAARIDAGSDAGVLRCTSDCDPRFDADGCVDDLRCTLAAEEPACSDAFGASEAGEPCTSVDGCAPGLACFRASRSAGGVCGVICCPGDDAATCEGTARCGGDGTLVDGTATAWGRCVVPRTCSVLSPELTCEAREGCYIVDGVGGTECRIAGTAEAGEACTVPEDCAAGLFCGGLATRTCLRVCSLTMTRACSSDERCVAQTYSPEGTGICVAATGARP